MNLLRVSVGAIALATAASQIGATDFSPPSFLTPPAETIIIDPPPVFPPNPDIWIRPTVGDEYPGIVGGIRQADGIGGTIYVNPNGHSGVSITGIPLD